jgi:hypothetical protein
VTVVWDEGSLQERLDQQYSPDAVVVASARQSFQP